jgi:hypothetical protein
MLSFQVLADLIDKVLISGLGYSFFCHKMNVLIIHFFVLSEIDKNVNEFKSY